MMKKRTGFQNNAVFGPDLTIFCREAGNKRLVGFLRQKLNLKAVFRGSL